MNELDGGCGSARLPKGPRASSSRSSPSKRPRLALRPRCSRSSLPLRCLRWLSPDFVGAMVGWMTDASRETDERAVTGSWGHGPSAWSILVHGGAGDVPAARRALHTAGCERAAAAGAAVLARGGSALDA